MESRKTATLAFPKPITELLNLINVPTSKSHNNDFLAHTLLSNNMEILKYFDASLPMIDANIHLCNSEQPIHRCFGTYQGTGLSAILSPYRKPFCNSISYLRTMQTSVISRSLSTIQQHPSQCCPAVWNRDCIISVT